MSPSALWSLLLVMTIAAMAPIASRLLPGRPPQVLFLIVGGVIIGPHVLGVAVSEDVALLAGLGLGFLFLLAGRELDPLMLREKAGKLALTSWMVSAFLAVVVVGGLAAIGFVHAFVPVSIALTTTALGTLLPILRDQHMLGGVFGRFIFAAGAVGELLPIVAISLFLGAYKTWWEALIIVSIGGFAYLLTVLAKSLAHTRLAAIIGENSRATSQSTLRITVVLLLALLLITQKFGIEAALGAFFAGMVLRRAAGGHPSDFEEKLDAVGYGFFIPVFFVSSGMALDVQSVASNPARMLVFLALLLAVRGVPALLIYRRALPLRQRWELAFLSATALPLLVALSEIGLSSGVMLPQNAAALVGAGVLSVAVFPLAAKLLHRAPDSVDLPIASIGPHGHPEADRLTPDPQAATTANEAAPETTAYDTPDTVEPTA
jgi:Kef-type K+ transport system membrane component KefB